MSLESETVRTLEDYQAAFESAIAKNKTNEASEVLKDMRKRGFNEYAKVLVRKYRLANLPASMSALETENDWPTQEQNG